MVTTEVTAVQNKGIGIAQAAEHMGISTDTVRRRLKKGNIAGVKAGREWRVFLPEKNTGNTDTNAKLIDALEARIKDQHEVIDTQAQQISELHILLQHTQAALNPPKQSLPWFLRWLGK